MKQSVGDKKVLVSESLNLGRSCASLPSLLFSTPPLPSLPLLSLYTLSPFPSSYLSLTSCFLVEEGTTQAGQCGIKW